MPLRSVLTTSNAGGTGTSSSSVFTLGGTEVAGDVAVLLTWQATGSNTVNGAGGATLRSGPDTGTTVFTGYVYSKTLTSGDISTGSITIGWNGSGRMIDAGAVYSGVDETGIIVGTTLVQTSASTSITLPSVTTTVASSDVIHFYVGRVGSGTPATPSWTGLGVTVDVAAAKTANGSGANALASTAHLTSPGAAGSYGGGSVTYTSTNTTGAWTLALPPTSSGFTGSASLSGSGTLSATGSPAAADVAALSGSGSLVATGTPAIPATATLSGSGTLTATGTPTATGSAALSGSGTLAATGTPAIPGIAALSGSGTLSASGTASGGGGSGSATLSGSGTLAASGTPTASGAASLSGSGALAAVGSPRLAGSAILSGSGTLAGSAFASFAVAAALSGLGTLTASGSMAGATTPGTMRPGVAVGPSMAAGVAAAAGMRAGAVSAASMSPGSAGVASMAPGTTGGASMRPA